MRGPSTGPSRTARLTWSYAQAERLEQEKRRGAVTINFVALNKLAIRTPHEFHMAARAPAGNDHSPLRISMALVETAPSERTSGSGVVAGMHWSHITAASATSLAAEGGRRKHQRPHTAMPVQTSQRPKTAPLGTEQSAAAVLRRPMTAQCIYRRARAQPGTGGSPTASCARFTWTARAKSIAQQAAACRRR
jgi:hypothetical protein